MSYARVDSLDSIQAFKVALVKFQESCQVALVDAESEVIRTLHWLETEHPAYWQSVIRKRTTIVERCTEELSAKRRYPDAFGRPQNTFAEEKALRAAKMALEEANQKLAATRKYANVMKKEMENYKGGVQRFSTSVQSDLPAAIAHLGAVLAKLHEYVAVNPAAVASQAQSATSAAPASTETTHRSMARQPAEETMTHGVQEETKQPEEP